MGRQNLPDRRPRRRITRKLTRLSFVRGYAVWLLAVVAGRCVKPFQQGVVKQESSQQFTAFSC